MKKPVLAVVIGLVLGGVGFGTYLAWQRSRPAPVPETAAQQQAPQPVTWTDPAGFTFEYPSGITINKHDEDQDNYAHVELTHPDHPGNVIVWAKDTTASDVTAWVRTEKKFKGANILDTSLGDLPAKKILLTDPATMIIVGTVSDDIVWTVEATSTDSEYWTNVHSMIADTFKFVSSDTPASSQTNDSSVSSDGSDEEPAADEEEVLE